MENHTLGLAQLSGRARAPARGLGGPPAPRCNHKVTVFALPALDPLGSGSGSDTWGRKRGLHVCDPRTPEQGAVVHPLVGQWWSPWALLSLEAAPGSGWVPVPYKGTAERPQARAFQSQRGLGLGVHCGVARGLPGEAG